MEFKGTKGKWVLRYPERTMGYYLLYIDNEYKEEVCNFRMEGLEPNEYDALLISKAPELLEMLIKCTDALNKTTEYDVLERYQKLVDDANKLITKATTL